MNRKSILVVDDEKNVRFTLLQALKSEGFDVDSASSGVEGLQKSLERSYDLLLVDLRMPGMTGLEMLREIRRRQADMPAVIITAYGVPQQLIEAAELGVIDCIRKPFSIQTLRSVVLDVFERFDDESPAEGDEVGRWLTKGKHALMNGHCAEAERFLRRASELDSSRPEPFILLGVCSLLQQKTEAAREFFRCALQVDPLNKSAGEYLVWLSTAQT